MPFGAFQASAFQFRTHYFEPHTYDAFQIDISSIIDSAGTAADIKKRKKQLDAILAEERRVKEQRRRDIEYAAFGPPLPEPPEFKLDPPSKQPDYSDLAKLLLSHKIDDEEEAIQLLLGAF